MARPTRTDDRIGAMEPDAEDETSSHPLPLVEEEVEPAAPTGGRRLDTHEWIALAIGRSEEHTSELQSLMRISYAVFCLNKNKTLQNMQFRKLSEETTITALP